VYLHHFFAFLLSKFEINNFKCVIEDVDVCTCVMIYIRNVFNNRCNIYRQNSQPSLQKQILNRVSISNKKKIRQTNEHEVVIVKSRIVY